MYDWNRLLQMTEGNELKQHLDSLKSFRVQESASRRYQVRPISSIIIKFGYDTNDDMQPQFGDGLDSDLFFIGVSAVALIERLAANLAEYMLHMAVLLS